MLAEPQPPPQLAAAAAVGDVTRTPPFYMFCFKVLSCPLKQRCARRVHTGWRTGVFCSFCC